jgi:hypothetical protein
MGCRVLVGRGKKVRNEDKGVAWGLEPKDVSGL